MRLTITACWQPADPDLPYVAVEALPPSLKCLADLRTGWRLDNQPFLGPNGAKIRQGREAVLWLRRTGVQPVMARWLLTDGTLQRRRLDAEGKEIRASWMWPLLSRDQVKKQARSKAAARPKGAHGGLARGKGGKQKASVAAGAQKEKDAGSKAARAEHAKLLVDADKQQVVKAVIRERLTNPRLHADKTRLDAAITRATKQVMNQSDRLTWRAQQIVDGRQQLAPTFVQSVRLAVQLMPEEMFQLVRVLGRAAGDVDAHEQAVKLASTLAAGGETMEVAEPAPEPQPPQPPPPPPPHPPPILG
eukprot:COSAG04_NODE_1535_length_6436_cov_10.274736_4_plen_304_part_00